MLVKNIRINEDGLAMFLGGTLETAIMVCFWENNQPLSSSAVHKQLLRNGYDLGYTTIAKVIHRLVTKNLLRHDRVKATYYPIFDTEDQFIDYCITETVKTLADQYPDSLKEAIASYA